MDFNDEAYLDEMKKDFLEESEEMLQMIEENILILEQDPESKEAINEIFRAAHTLKGGSATVGFDQVQKFTHVWEDVLMEIREGKIKVTGRITDILLKCQDVLNDLINAAKDDVEYKGNLDQNLQLVKSILGEDKKETKTEETPVLEVPKEEDISSPDDASAGEQTDMKAESANMRENLTKFEKLNIEGLEEGVDGGQNLYFIRVWFDPEAEMVSVGPIQVYSSLKEIGGVHATLPNLEVLQSDNVPKTVDYLVGSHVPLSELLEACHLPDMTLNNHAIPIKLDDLKVVARANLAEEKKETPSQADAKDENQENANNEAKPKSSEKPDGPSKTKEGTKKKNSTFLRVDSERIDQMLNLVGELTINKSGYAPIDTSFHSNIVTIKSAFDTYRQKVSQILERAGVNMDDQFTVENEILTKSFGEVRDTIASFKTSWQELDRITNDLRGHVMKIRMVTVGQIFNRMPRIVRDLARERGKDIEVSISGEATEMDKSVVEELLDPIIHIVRNSVDHGIEDPPERDATGKEEKGYLSLSASHEGNVIIIKIKDDGRGIDADNVYESAIKKGVISKTDVLSEKEKIMLIFEAGFSTAKEITSISGRGVGMDVVRKRIEGLNGSISVETIKGQGTELTLKLPLTLTIMQALLVGTHTEVYSIPITSISETMRIEPKDIEFIEDKEVITVRGEVISVMHISEVFHLPKSNLEEQYAVIVTQEEMKLAVIIDELIGEQDIVIKAIKNSLISAKGIAGAANLGDGTITFILDINTLVKMGHQNEKTDEFLVSA